MINRKTSVTQIFLNANATTYTDVLCGFTWFIGLDILFDNFTLLVSGTKVCKIKPDNKSLAKQTLENYVIF